MTVGFDGDGMRKKSDRIEEAAGSIGLAARRSILMEAERCGEASGLVG